MVFRDAAAEREYEYWLRQLDEEEAPSEFICLRIEDVLRAHFLLLDHFSDTGVVIGGVGPRDMNLLQSTVSRQYTGFGPITKWDSQLLVVATLFCGLVRNHPFHDANKRTALLCMLYHLERTGRCMELNDQELEDFTVDLADHRLESHRKNKERKRRLLNVDEEVRFVARWIRRNSRPIDNDHREITYNRLQAILGQYNFALINPRGNKIDLVRYDERRSILRLGKKEIITTRIRRVGFHSWKSTVPKGVLKSVREAADLTLSKGVDSKVFYGYSDPIDYLIGRYETPLRNLADR